MHGIFCNFLAQYVESAYGRDLWSDLHYAAGIAPRRYKPTIRYAEEEVLALLQKLAATTGQPLSNILENVGESFAPHLLSIYSALVRPEASTLQVLATVEDIAHRTVRLHNPDASPPSLKCLWRTEREMELIYSSRRKLCPLAKGIIRGIAGWLDETVEVADTSCMLLGDPYCCLSIVVTSPASAEPGRRRPASVARRPRTILPARRGRCSRRRLGRTTGFPRPSLRMIWERWANTGFWRRSVKEVWESSSWPTTFSSSAASP